MPYRTVDIRSDPRFEGWPDAHPTMRSFLGVPIVSKGEVIRRVLPDGKDALRAGTFSDEDLGLIQRPGDITVVGQAADGAEAVAQAAELRPDVVVMDVVMPGADGLAATRTVTRTSLDTKVLVLSSFGERKRVTAVLRAGASGYLLKDTEPEQPAATIRAVHRGDAVIPADRAREALELLPELPTTTLTILFTDIEGSTQVVEQLGDERARRSSARTTASCATCS